MNRFLGLVIGLAVLLALTGCGNRERTVRFRITYTFDTPSGERSGSHVLESYYGPCSGAAMGPGCAQGVRGEAAVIDLGEGKTVFAILATGAQGQNVGTPMWVADETYRAEVVPLCKSIREPAGGCHISDVPTDAFPPRELTVQKVFTMVAFKDINDPSTAMVVHACCESGLTNIDAIEQTFGVGYAFKGAVIEIAKGEEVTRGGIEAELPWWLSSGRPAALALRSAGLITGSAIDAEYAFIRK